ncbi:hypothetical protein BGZ98_003492 [Dissophora globulifera]|nr:hypothetical protein BGZ98_003492 [Dissophora globulifera]
MGRRMWEVALENTDLAMAAEGMDAGQIHGLVSSKVEDLLNKYIYQVDQDSLSRSNQNAALFLQHMIIYLELRAAIKIGDIGRIEESLKWITIMFQSGSKSNYAKELLHIHCALRYVWKQEE